MYQKRKAWNPINGLSPPHFCACPKPGFVFNNLTIYRLYFLLLYIAPLSRYLKFYIKLDCSEVYIVVLYREKGANYNNLFLLIERV